MIHRDFRLEMIYVWIAVYDTVGAGVPVIEDLSGGSDDQERKAYKYGKLRHGNNAIGSILY